MFGTTYRARYGINYLMNVLFISLILGGMLGRNTITHEVNVGNGLHRLWSMAGGVKSLGLLFLVAVAIIGFGYGLTALTDNPGVNNLWVGVIGAGVVLLVLWAGNNWFSGPTGTGLLIFGYFAAIAVLTAIVTVPQRHYC